MLIKFSLEINLKWFTVYIKTRTQICIRQTIYYDEPSTNHTKNDGTEGLDFPRDEIEVSLGPTGVVLYRPGRAEALSILL